MGELVKKQKQSNAPAWFVEFEKRNNQRFEDLETSFNQRLDNLIAKNNLKE